MKKRLLKIFGALLIFTGFFLLVIQPFTPLTGAVIETSSKIAILNFFISITLIVIGIIIFSSGLQPLEELTETLSSPELRIEMTKEFLKSIKGKDKRAIDRAIKKIPKGLGKPKMREKGDYKEPIYQIKVDKGGRIFYNQDNQAVYLLEYVPSSEHKKRSELK